MVDGGGNCSETECFVGFFRSVALRNENALQDTLRLLTLWFKYGALDEVSQGMAEGFSAVEVDTWLEVIPQVDTGDYHVYPDSYWDSDYRPDSDTECQRATQYQQLAERSWKTSPASSHLPAHRSIKVL